MARQRKIQGTQEHNARQAESRDRRKQARKQRILAREARWHDEVIGREAERHAWPFGGPAGTTSRGSEEMP